MELKGPELCLYTNHSKHRMGFPNILKVVSNHSENCDKVQEDAEMKEESENWPKFCGTFDENRILKKRKKKNSI